MKKKTAQHEILLYTGSNFSQRQLCSREENDKGKKLSAIEELEKACWNGVLYEMFPEILGSTYPKCESFLWHVISGKNFVYINIGPNPVMADQDTSIDPYSYIIRACEN